MGRPAIRSTQSTTRLWKKRGPSWHLETPMDPPSEASGRVIATDLVNGDDGELRLSNKLFECSNVFRHIKLVEGRDHKIVSGDIIMSRNHALELTIDPDYDLKEVLSQEQIAGEPIWPNNLHFGEKPHVETGDYQFNPGSCEMSEISAHYGNHQKLLQNIVSEQIYAHPEDLKRAKDELHKGRRGADRCVTCGTRFRDRSCLCPSCLPPIPPVLDRVRLDNYDPVSEDVHLRDMPFGGNSLPTIKEFFEQYISRLDAAYRIHGVQDRHAELDYIRSQFNNQMTLTAISWQRIPPVLRTAWVAEDDNAEAQCNNRATALARQMLHIAFHSEDTKKQKQFWDYRASQRQLDYLDVIHKLIPEDSAIMQFYDEMQIPEWQYTEYKWDSVKGAYFDSRRQMFKIMISRHLHQGALDNPNFITKLAQMIADPYAIREKPFKKDGVVYPNLPGSMRLPPSHNAFPDYLRNAVRTIGYSSE